MSRRVALQIAQNGIRTYTGAESQLPRSNSRPVSRKKIAVGFIGFDGVAALDMVGPLEALKKARHGDALELQCYEILTLGLSTKRFLSESGLLLTAESTIAKAPELDTVIVPGGRGVFRSETRDLLGAWLSQRTPNTRRVVSVCAGIYPVAAAGILGNRTITTHWRYAQDVAQRFPDLQVNHMASYSRDGPFYSCGGGSAAIEMTLSLIEEDYGRAVALNVAKDLVMQLRPAGDNERAMLSPDYEVEPTDRLSDLPAWILGRLRENLSVDVLAKRACLCPRHFSRLFKTMFGVTPGTFVENARLEEGRVRLMRSRSSVNGIAAAIGFKSADAFRRAFQRRLGVTPREFRQSVKTPAVNANVQAVSYPEYFEPFQHRGGYGDRMPPRIPLFKSLAR
jgi:transcriptional regulator GlxA family with amidase domain